MTCERMEAEGERDVRKLYTKGGIDQLGLSIDGWIEQWIHNLRRNTFFPIWPETTSALTYDEFIRSEDKTAIFHTSFDHDARMLPWRRTLCVNRVQHSTKKKQSYDSRSITQRQTIRFSLKKNDKPINVLCRMLAF